eukprot:3397136-Rhodomonas_salina.3
MGQQAWVRSALGVNTRVTKVACHAPSLLVSICGDLCRFASICVDLRAGLNSPSAARPQAIKLILLERGVTMYKVFVLVGGPDWPTSVLTGLILCLLCDVMSGSETDYAASRRVENRRPPVPARHAPRDPPHRPDGAAPALSVSSLSARGLRVASDGRSAGRKTSAPQSSGKKAVR